MAARSDAGGMVKIFEHREITWKIENYFLATFGKNWIIDSPVIYVREPWTKWKMFLTPDPEDDESMFIQLQRLEYDTGPNAVWADWLMTLIAMKGEYEVKYHTWEERKMSFKVNESHGDILKKEHILEHIVPPFQDKDTFYIRFQLFVSHENVDEKYEQFDCDDSLTNLQNFIQMREGGKYYDIEIINMMHKIKAHKEVLMSRSRYFERHIKRGTKYITLDLDRVDFANIIAFFYSGDLKYVLSKPNVILLEYITQLEIEELEPHYFPNLTKLYTALDVQYDEFWWEIENISNSTDGTIITSPIIYDSSFKTSWKLELQIKLWKKSMRMSISAKTMAYVNRMLVYVEFVPMNSYHNCYPRSRMIDFIHGNVMINTKTFFKIKKSEIRSFLPDNKLYITFKIQMLLSKMVSKGKEENTYFFQ